MDFRPRTFLSSVVVVGLGALLAGCTGVGGDEFMVHFGLNGDNNAGCERVLVEVDLSAADAEIARRDDESIHCALSGLLESSGCKVDFLDVDDADILQVEIYDCDVEAGSNLFRCGFTEADLDSLEAATRIICACDRFDCDDSPPVCLGLSSDIGPCEDCNNRVDDDGDEVADCADPSCADSRLCDGVTTTSTTTSTSTSTTTTSSSSSTTTTEPPVTTTTEFPPTTTMGPDTTTTTTTVPTGGGPFDVTFRMDTASSSIGALQFTADYAGAAGEFDGTGPTAACTNKVAGALFAPNDNDATSKLTLGLIALSPFSAPLDLVTCTFTAEAGETPVPGDFVITIDDATDVDGGPATVGISVQVAAQ